MTWAFPSSVRVNEYQPLEVDLNTAGGILRGMANNRLFLIDSRTGNAICIAKGFGEWRLGDNVDRLAAFLEEHDDGGAQGLPTSLRLADEHDPGVRRLIETQTTWKPSRLAAALAPKKT